MNLCYKIYCNLKFVFFELLKVKDNSLLLLVSLFIICNYVD